MNKKLLMLFAIPPLFFMGCAGNIKPVQTSTYDNSTSIKLVENDIQDADQSVQQVIPKVDAVSSSKLQDAHGHLINAQVNVQTALKTEAASQKEIKQYQTQLETDNQKLTAYKSRWLGDRTIRDIKWIVGVYALLGVLGSVLSVMGGGWLGIAGTQILHFLPFSNIFSILVNLLQRKTKTGV